MPNPDVYGVVGVVGAYAEPDAKAKEAMIWKPMAWYTETFYCTLAAGVGNGICGQILRYFGWANWLSSPKGTWEPNWKSLLVSFASSMLAYQFIKSRERRKRHSIGLPKGAGRE